MTLPPALREFVESLNSENVRYVIAGGYAVVFHGHPRFTGDLDVFIEHSPENAKLVDRAIRAFGFGSLGLKPSDFEQPDVIVQLGRPPQRIDVITSIDAVEFAEAWSTRIEVEIEGVRTAFIGKQLLLRNKRAAGRPKDLADVEALTPKPPKGKKPRHK